MATSTSPTRNAAATREAILRSAIENFARAGYDGVGVRQIAHDAGVTAMLVNRYFGSKEGLFAEAVETSFATPTFIGEQSDDLVADTVRALVARTGSGDDAPPPFMIMLRSARARSPRRSCATPSNATLAPGWLGNSTRLIRICAARSCLR